MIESQHSVFRTSRQLSAQILQNVKFCRQNTVPEILKIFTFRVGFEIEFFVLSLHENIPLPESDRGRLRRCLGILRDPTYNPPDAGIGIPSS